MRRTVLILGLVAASVLALTPELFAQRFGIGVGRGGVSIGTGGGYGSGFGSGYNSGWPGSYGYGSNIYGQSGFGSGFYNQPGSNFYSQPSYYGSSGWGQSPYYSGSSQNYYSQPSYYSSGMSQPRYSSGMSQPSYYSSGTTSQYPSTDYRSSYFAPAPTAESAIFTLLVPDSNAQVFFDGAPTQQRGFERMYHSPPLESDNLAYTIKVRWNENGREVEQQRKVDVQRGRNVVVNFRDSKTGENLPAPPSTQQQQQNRQQQNQQELNQQPLQRQQEPLPNPVRPELP